MIKSMPGCHPPMYRLWPKWKGSRGHDGRPSCFKPGSTGQFRAKQYLVVSSNDHDVSITLDVGEIDKAKLAKNW